MVKVNCKYCGHAQRIRNSDMKCGVCLKKGFADNTQQNKSPEPAQQ